MLAAVTEPAVVLEDVWKRYPPHREPNALVRALARLGGVDLQGGPLSEDVDEDEDEEEEAEQDPARAADEWVDAVAGISLAIARGRCLGVVGPPKSGKSVLLRLIAGMTPPSAGRIVVYGAVAPALPSMTKFVPSRVGIRKTLLALAMMTRLSRRQVKARLPEIFAFAGLPLTGPPGATLTPPQKERLLLAMMLTIDADVVLVDVPLGSGRTRDRFVERIRERTRGGAAVVVTADAPAEIEDVADELVYLESGRVVDVGEALADAGTEEASGPAPERKPDPLLDQLPLSPDAERYLDHLRLLHGDVRAVLAHRAAVVRALRTKPEAARLEWTDLAAGAGLDWVQQVGVVERLRRADGVGDDEPIAPPAPGPRDLPLSGDAGRYLDFLRVACGGESADDALRHALAYAPPNAARVEWTWLARWAGFDWIEHVPLVERLRERTNAADDEPVYGALAARERAAKQGRVRSG